MGHPSQNRVQSEINSRTLVLFDSLEKATGSIYNFFNSLANTNQLLARGVIIGEETLFQDKNFKKIVKESDLFPKVKACFPREVSSLLGSTHDFIIQDLRENFNPNKLIILAETVVGGGLIILIGEKHDYWIKTVNKSRFGHSKKSNLLIRFLKEIKNNESCRLSVNKEINLHPYYRPISLSKVLSKEILKIPISNSQYDLIKSLSKELGEKKKESIVNVIVADRGRGKSAATGLTIAYALMNYITSECRVTLTAQTIAQTQSIFLFVTLGFNSLKVKYNVQRLEDQIVGIFLENGSKIQYRNPEELSKDIKSTILIVDEAATFPQSKLTEIISSKTKKVLISTIHGYEGTGRSFQYKILDMIKRKPQYKINLYSLNDPIRYSAGDLIEALLNETFLLQVEPPMIGLEEFDKVNADIELLSIDTSSELIFERELKLLKEIMGLLIFSHYRNQPNDLLLLTDSYRHSLAYLTSSTQGNQKSILLACQLAIEGALPDYDIEKIEKGHFIEGDLIPAVAIRYFSTEFAQFKGIRIVRIASHPKFRNKGLGRIAVENLIKRYESLDWIGVSFGATGKLIKFWKKFGFKIIHIRPIKTPETSEWNIVLVKPLSDRAITIVEEASRNFFLQFIHLLKQSLFDLKPELALLIIHSCVSIPNYQMKITQSGNYRLKKYIEGKINFLLAVDVLQELAIAYFAAHIDVKLSSSQELLLISRILQGRTWGQTLGKTGLSWKEANGLLINAIKKITGAVSNLP